MFLLIPLIFFLFSVGAIIWIITRKFVYLKKLAPEAMDNSVLSQESLLSEFLPELVSWLKKKNIREFRINFLAEFEKFLRRLRLISLKLDTFTNSLIHRVRTSAAYHGEALKEQTASEQQADAGKAKDRKEEEQRLIIEIAKNPKNAELYKKLGNLYVKTGENRDAAESFKKALELNPEDAAVKSRLEKILSKLEKAPR